MDNISIFDDIIKRLENTYHCDICGNEVKFEDIPLKGNFIICDECKEAIKYAKELRKNELQAIKSLSYKYVTRYYVAIDGTDWEDHIQIHHYTINTTIFPENQVPDNNDITYFTNLKDAQKVCNKLNRDWEKVYGKQ